MKDLLARSLKRLVEREPRHAKGQRNALVLTVASNKGGVGKTTTAVNLAAALARQHQLKTLLIDLDATGCVRRALAQLHPDLPASAHRIFDEAQAADPIELLRPSRLDRLDLILSDDTLNQTEKQLHARLGRELVLREALRVVRTHYDVILLDAAPSLNLVTLNALCATDLVLLPTDASPLGVQGIEAMLRTLATVAQTLHPGLGVLGVVMTRVDGRSPLVNQQATDALRALDPDLLLPVQIRLSTALLHAQNAGVDVFAHDPRSRAADDYRALGTHIAQSVRTRLAAQG